MMLVICSQIVIILYQPIVQDNTIH